MSSTSETSASSRDLLQPLRDAVATGQADAILHALPEPPMFLSTVFTLPNEDRDRLLAAVLQVLPTEEDHWEIIEAAAMDSIAHPERGTFIAVASYIPTDMLDDARKLLAMFPDRDAAEKIDALFNSLGRS